MSLSLDKMHLASWPLVIDRVHHAVVFAGGQTHSRRRRPLVRQGQNQAPSVRTVIRNVLHQGRELPGHRLCAPFPVSTGYSHRQPNVKEQQSARSSRSNSWVVGQALGQLYFGPGSVLIQWLAQ